MLKPFVLFAIVRCLSALTVSWLLPLQDSRPLNATFQDLGLYSGSSGGSEPPWRLPNPLYAALVRGIGYGFSQLQDWRYQSLSLGLTIALSGIFVMVASRVLKPKQTLFYAALLGAHPYLALYSLKLDTSIFALLPVGFVMATALTPVQGTWALMVTAVSSLMRNALLPMGWLQTLEEPRQWRSIPGYLAIVVLAGSTTLQLSYGASYVGQNYGCYSLARISSWLAEQGAPSPLAKTFGLILTPIIHLVLDLGAREAVANHCLFLPSSIAQRQSIHILSTALFLMFHAWLLWRLYRTVRTLFPEHPKSLRLALPLSMLLPTFYGAAHMRYLIPIIPLMLLSIFHITPITHHLMRASNRNKLGLAKP